MKISQERLDEICELVEYAFETVKSDRCCGRREIEETEAEKQLILEALHMVPVE